MLNIAILDDEDIYMKRICKITKECMRQMDIDYRTRVYTTGEDLLADFRKEEYFDLYLLDVELPGANGLEVAKHIRRRYTEPVIIYISNHMNYAIRAFEVNTYRYIIKNELEKELPRAYHSMGPLLREKKEEEGFYTIEYYREQEKIYFRDIFYLMKDGKYVVFVHVNGKSQIRAAMGEIYKQLPSERFLMIDRSYVVNIEYMETLKNYKICLRNGIELPVSQPKWPAVRDFFINKR